jgi:acyl-coenzyme A thioesterase PaaI-like protein
MSRMKASRLRLGMNLWPPFLFAGIRVVELSDDYRYAKVRLRMHRWNRNYVGTHFGGSLFAMTDPFWMLLLLHHLRRDHVVWDKAGEIEFVKPGRGTVHAEFRLTDEQLAEVRSLAAEGGKALVWFTADVVDAAGEVVARTRKQVYARRKKSLDGGALRAV